MSFESGRLAVLGLIFIVYLGGSLVAPWPVEQWRGSGDGRSSSSPSGSGSAAS